MKLEEQQFPWAERLERCVRRWPPEVYFIDLRSRGVKLKPLVVRYSEEEAH